MMKLFLNSSSADISSSWHHGMDMQRHREHKQSTFVRKMGGYGDETMMIKLMKYSVF